MTRLQHSCPHGEADAQRNHRPARAPALWPRCPGCGQSLRYQPWTWRIKIEHSTALALKTEGHPRVPGSYVGAPRAVHAPLKLRSHTKNLNEPQHMPFSAASSPRRRPKPSSEAVLGRNDFIYQATRPPASAQAVPPTRGYPHV